MGIFKQHLNTNSMKVSPEAKMETKNKMRRFWERYSVGFTTWWSSDAIGNKRNDRTCREDFVRDVYPTIVNSLDDRYSIPHKEKVYEHRYDEYLIFLPEFTVEYLCAGSNLPNLIEAWIEGGSLVSQASELVVKMRQLFRAGQWPKRLSEMNEYKKQFNMKKGDLAIVHSLSDDTFGRMVRVKDPATFMNGSGNTMLGEKTFNMFDMGLLMFPFEFDKVNEMMGVIQHVTVALIDEYKEEILLISPHTAAALMSCHNCGGGGDLKKCANCLLTWYCSRECQREHWKEHKKICKLANPKNAKA